MASLSIRLLIYMAHKISYTISFIPSVTSGGSFCQRGWRGSYDMLEMEKSPTQYHYLPAFWRWSQNNWSLNQWSHMRHVFHIYTLSSWLPTLTRILWDLWSFSYDHLKIKYKVLRCPSCRSVFLFKYHNKIQMKILLRSHLFSKDIEN